MDLNMGWQDTSIDNYCPNNKKRRKIDATDKSYDHEKVVDYCPKRRKIDAGGKKSYDRETVVINNASIEQAQQLDPTSIIMLDIKLKKHLWIAAQSTAAEVETKIVIQGPITNVCMHVKRHNDFPNAGALKTNGFISPWEACVLTVDLDNTTTNGIT